MSKDLELTSLKLAGFPIESQAAPTAFAADGTLTVNNLRGGLISITAAATVTLPTAALLVAGVPGAAANNSFDFAVVNTSGAIFTLGAGGATILGDIRTGLASATESGSSQWRVRITTATAGSEAYTVYRLG
jgi:hypothetical protein